MLTWFGGRQIVLSVGSTLENEHHIIRVFEHSSAQIKLESMLNQTMLCLWKCEKRVKSDYLVRLFSLFFVRSVGQIHNIFPTSKLFLHGVPKSLPSPPLYRDYGFIIKPISLLHFSQLASVYIPTV
ncbi:hypothetical protein M0802_003471 [Mischocyttarus mexicanus]|nr:hypothetical protein M0802_003471 [Mischocyttarus mexicanus]